LLRVDTQGLMARGGDIATAVRELLVETKLAKALLFFDDCEILFATRLQGNRHLQQLLAGLDSVDDAVILATQLDGMLDPSVYRRVAFRVSLTIPSPSLREKLWRLKLGTKVSTLAELDIAFLAEKYEFNGSQIGVAARLALAQAVAREPEGDALSVTDQDLEHGAEALMLHHLEQLAVKSVSHLRLEDVVLPDTLMGLIRSILAAVRNRRRIFEEWGFGERLITGRGLAMLFRGESGTGKTLTAEVLGSELAMPLYRVAIPRIVSKYIGETEQNLEKAFKEAQVAGAILLFDEADAIFSKRVDVGTATDRYSNMEVNLLLQELERFEGIVILTTNLDAAIDDAFDRRLNYKLDFPFPTPDLRRRIWARHLPPKAPVELSDDELDYLAETFELSGGSIKNVALRAAYSAAEAGSTMNVENLEAASVQEYRELGKLVRS
jgi:SpoVK/Ycf46/Vps4 family AAA+-type ATPase